MSNSIYENDIFFRELISNYMDKLFYFCLKKTGDQYEAENLAADIVLNVLSSHQRWPATVSFPAWFWQIARNRYSVWAKKKKEHEVWISEFDVGEYNLEDEDSRTEELILQKENIDLLRRELAFITSSYREVIVAYYIEDKSVKEIAAASQISESAVKVNLFRARKALKEGMDMARTFGIRSYQPGEVNITINGDGSRHMYRYIERLLPQNILLEAYQNPSTIEELAIALGIAVPYLEDEIKVLTDKGFIKKIGNRYVTNFFIGSKESQYEIYSLQSRYIKELSREIDTIVSDLVTDIRGLGMICENHKNEDLKWLLVLYTADVICGIITHDDHEGFKIISFENNNIPERSAGHRYLHTDNFTFFKYFVINHGFENNSVNMFVGEAELLADIVKRKRTFPSLTPSERLMWDRWINNKIAYVKEDGTIIPRIFTVTESNKRKMDEMIKSHPLAEKVSATFSEITKKSTQIFMKECPQDFADNCIDYALENMRRMLTMLINEEVESGRLTVPETPATSTACCYFTVKEI